MMKDGNVNVKAVTAADWAKLGGAAQAMKAAALSLADAPRVVVAPAGTKLQDEGAPGNATAAQIQGFIDANPGTSLPMPVRWRTSPRRS